MGSIEEDIEIVKSLIEDTKKSLISNTGLSQYRKSNRTIAYKALEHLLLDYERQKQINEEHQKINGELREKVKVLESKNNYLESLSDCQHNYLINSIPKQKIKEIVDECIPKKENIITHEIKYSPNTNANSYLTEQILKLLQESEDK